MRLYLALPLLALLATSAHAGRPLVTEDAGVLDRGDCEWEPVAGRSTAQGSPAETTLSTQIGCGAGMSSQLAVALGQSRSAGQTSLGLSLGAKTQLIDGGESGSSLTLAYGAAWARDANGGNGFRLELGSVNLVSSTPLAEGWTGHVNLGRAYYREDRVTRTTWALALENDFNETVGWGAEAFGESGSRPWLGVGLRWDATETLNINLSYAQHAGAEQARMVTLGAKLAF